MGSGVKQVFLLDRQTSSVTQATQLRNTNSADSAEFCADKSAFDDGQVIAYVSDNQIFVLEGHEQTPRPIAQLSESRLTNPVAVSPLGDLVAYNDEKPGILAPVCSDQVFVADLLSGEVRQVSDFYDYGVGTLVFSPDGEKIAFSAVKCAIGGFGGSHVGIIQVDGVAKEFKDFDSSHTIVSQSLFFSPDGALFGFIVNESEDSAAIYLYSLTK